MISANAGNQGFEGQRVPAMQQMASAYGLLQARGPQAAAPAAAGPSGQPGSQSAWSWGPGGSQGGSWGLPGTQQPHMGASSEAPSATFGHPGSGGHHLAGVMGSGVDTPLAYMPDALAHLLSAAEAASSEQK